MVFTTGVQRTAEFEGKENSAEDDYSFLIHYLLLIYRQIYYIEEICILVKQGRNFLYLSKGC